MNSYPRQLRTAPSSLMLALILSAVSAFAQAAPSDSPINLSGTVLDAVTSQPIFRALVRLSGSSNQRAVLTDAEGHFAFPNADPTNITITAIKPGYTFAQGPSDPTDLNLQAASLTGPVQLTLYPEAILKATLTGTNGEPLPNIEVTAYRDLYDESGHHWSTAAMARSNSHGHVRLPVPAGDYRIESGFVATSSTTAVLPYAFPPPSTATGQQTIHVHSGEQIDLDLHPATAPLLEATIRLASSGPHEVSSLSVTAADSAPFQVPVKSSENSADLHATLPAGSYTLEARHDDRDGADQATVTLTPGQHQPVLISLHFAPIASIPLDVAIDDAATSAAISAGTTLVTPSPRTLGLSLEPVAAAPGADSEPIRNLQTRYNNVSLLAPAGAYRLRAQPGREWYILSAISGGTDLLTHDLLVASATPAPIQLMVSNLHASLQGVTSLNGNPARTWIYLIPSTPAAFSIIRLLSTSNGSFLNTAIPPGTYRAIAFEHRHQLNPDDPNALAPFNTHVSTITLHAGDKSTLNLDAVPNAELRP